MTLEFRFCEDAAEWDSFVRASPLANIFCETRFLRALDVKPLLAGVYERGELVLGAVLLSADGTLLPAPYPFTSYHGLVPSRRFAGLPTHTQAPQMLRATAFLLTELEQRFSQIGFCLHPRFQDIRGFSWFHYDQPDEGQFTVDVRYTGLLDLRDYSGLAEHERTLRRNRRREVRRASSTGLEVASSADLDRFADLYVETFARQGITVPADTLAIADRIWRAALAEGFGRLWCCRTPQGAEAAMAVFLYDERCAYYLFAGNDPEFRDSGATTLLFLKAIWHARDQLGVRFVDLVGMNSPQRGDYKASFNAEPAAYYVVSWERPSPAARSASLR